jgi:hypothetical protein
LRRKKWEKSVAFGRSIREVCKVIPPEPGAPPAAVHVANSAFPDESLWGEEFDFED